MFEQLKSYTLRLIPTVWDFLQFDRVRVLDLSGNYIDKIQHLDENKVGAILPRFLIKMSEKYGNSGIHHFLALFTL